jgi:uncharacterized SAM-binding protein YcdF (DUF218 family)
MPISIENTINLILAPLTLSWLMMMVSLFAQLGKRSRVALICNLIAVVVLWVAGASLIGGAAAQRLEMWNPAPSPLPHAEAIVVLAGVTRKAYPPQPVPHLGAGGDRLVYAAKLYHEGKAPLVAISGDRNESAEMAEIMEMMGVPRSAMLEEDISLQNTYMAALAMKQALIAHNVHSALIVTSAIRMPRAIRVFERLGFHAIAAPTDFITHRNALADGLLGIASMFLPTVGGLGVSTAVAHELLGLGGYRLAGWI